MTGTHEDAAGPRDERENMPRRHDMLGTFGRVDRHRHGTRAVARRDTRRDAIAGLDRDCEGGLVPSAILRAHQIETELIHPLLAQRQADQPLAMHRHEVDRRRRRHLCRDNEIALILPILVINKDEHPAITRLVDYLGRRREEWVTWIRGYHCYGHLLHSSVDRSVASTIANVCGLVLWAYESALWIRRSSESS